MKRAAQWLSVVVILAGVVAIVAGCGSQPTQTSGPHYSATGECIGEGCPLPEVLPTTDQAAFDQPAPDLLGVDAPAPNPTPGG
jgi:hypothetical protein